MNDGQNGAEMWAATASPALPRSYCWIPTMALEPGMVIARPLFGGSGGHLSIHLAVGSRITASTISQLVNKGVECVAVLQQATVDEATYADIVCQYASRLHEIFGPDPDEHCAPLFEALLAAGPDPC